MLISYKEGIIEAGIDEAGRGPIAGPVVAAAVILPLDFNEPRLRDSKKMSEKARYEVEKVIQEKALAWKVVEISEARIDEINILEATYEAMNQAVEGLEIKPEFLLIDGNRFRNLVGIEHCCIVKGDDKYLSIAAASVLAKCHRDRLMDRLHLEHPEYNWLSNKGYPTRTHKEAVAKFGVTKYHRRTFAGVSEWVNTLF